MFYLIKAVMQLDDSVGATFSAINYCTTTTYIDSDPRVTSQIQVPDWKDKVKL
jgi:hypothetical protein